MFRFVLKGDFSISDAMSIVNDIHQEYGDDAQVSLETPRSLPAKAEPATEVITLVGAVASIIAALVTLLSEVRNASLRDSWSAKKLRELVDDKMITKGICDFEITEISNFESLLDNAKQPCAVIGHDKRTDRKYKLYLFKDKDVYVLELEQL